MKILTNEMVDRFEITLQNKAKDGSMTNAKFNEMCQNELAEVLNEVRFYCYFIMFLFY